MDLVHIHHRPDIVTHLGLGIRLGAGDDIFAAEISSYQLLTIKSFRPVAAAILNLSPDHLDRHGSLENYYQTKARIFENQTEDDILVLNADDSEVMRIAEKALSKKVLFSYDTPQRRLC